MQMFGSSGHLSRPEGSTLAAYTACFPQHHMENHHIKTIANTAFVDGVTGDPHHFRYKVRCARLRCPMSSIRAARKYMHLTRFLQGWGHNGTWTGCCMHPSTAMQYHAGQGRAQLMSWQLPHC